MTTLWLRTDGSRTIGLGHVMRMVALAQASRERDLEPCFVLSDDPVTRGICERFGFPSITEEVWPPNLAGTAVVFDGYQFDVDDHLDAYGRGALTVAAMDDWGVGHFEVDLLVNQNLVSGLDVQLPTRSRTLVGPRYALVRQEFREVNRARADDGSRLLVTLGGTDTTGLARPVLEAVTTTRLFDEVVLLTGRTGSDDVPRGVEVIRDPISVAKLFASVDIAVSAAGSTTWELLCMGVPTALIQTEGNQQHVANPVADSGAALLFGHGSQLDVGVLPLLLDSSVRRDLRRRGTELVDGLGAQRVADAIIELIATRQ